MSDVSIICFSVHSHFRPLHVQSSHPLAYALASSDVHFTRKVRRVHFTPFTHKHVMCKGREAEEAYVQVHIYEMCASLRLDKGSIVTRKRNMYELGVDFIVSICLACA